MIFLSFVSALVNLICFLIFLPSYYHFTGFFLHKLAVGFIVLVLLYALVQMVLMVGMECSVRDF
jgi:hypothetical protein